MAESRIMKMKIYLNCVREHCVVFKHLVIQLNHQYGFHYDEGLQAGRGMGHFGCFGGYQKDPP